MLKLFSITLLTVAFAIAAFAAKRFPLAAASIVPAAKGSVEIGHDRNGNTEIKLTVEHLANPTSLSPSQANYVVWLQDKTSGPENRGELRVNGKLEGIFQTVTPRNRKNFDLFVTGENDGTAKSPSGPEVLRTTVSR
jgi:hypothetical protein